MTFCSASVENSCLRKALNILGYDDNDEQFDEVIDLICKYQWDRHKYTVFFENSTAHFIVQN